jgi:hypothetical protein
MSKHQPADAQDRFARSARAEVGASVDSESNTYAGPPSGVPSGTWPIPLGAGLRRGPRDRFLRRSTTKRTYPRSLNKRLRGAAPMGGAVASGAPFDRDLVPVVTTVRGAV